MYGEESWRKSVERDEIREYQKRKKLFLNIFHNLYFLGSMYDITPTNIDYKLLNII